MGRKRDTATAQAQIDLQYGPQFRQVRDLWNQTHSQYLNDLSAARETSRAVQRQANASKPVVQDIYDSAAKGLKRSNSFVDKALATAPAATAPASTSALGGLLTQAMLRERGSANNANTAARTGALTELVQRASGAEAGKALAYNTAKSNLLSTRKQLTQRLADLTGESQSQMTVLTNQLSDKRDANRVTKDTAQAKIDAAAQKKADADKKAAKEHVDKVHTATGDYINKIADAQADWDRFSRSKAPKTETVMENGKPKIDATTGQIVTRQVVDAKGNTVYEYPKPDDIRQMLADVRDSSGHIKYTPGDIHVALLVGNGPSHPGKPLDAAALAYLKKLAGHGVRIPRAWTMNVTDRAIANNEVAGPPRPHS
jgi:hypothetical protein